MKKSIKFLVAGAFVLFAAMSCTKEQNVPVDSNKNQVTINFVSDGQLAGTSKTVLNSDNTVSWSAGTDKIAVIETINGVSYAKTSSGASLNGEGQATFSANFDENTTGAEYIYNAIYPATSWVSGLDSEYSFNLGDMTEAKVLTPTSQTPPSLDTFDPAADLLVAKKITLDNQATFSSLDLYFARLVALGKMTIKNLPTSDPILRICLDTYGADNTMKPLSGRSYVDLNTGKVKTSAYGDTGKGIEILYDASLNFTSGKTAIFTCLSAELTSGDKFTVKVITAANTYVREVTLSDAQELRFEAGKSTSFIVDMSTATATPNKDYSSSKKYVLVLTSSGKNYALSGTKVVDKNRLTAPLIDLAEAKYTTDEDLMWTIEKGSVPNHTLKNVKSGLYASWPSGNAVDMSSNAYDLIIEEDGEYYIFKSAEDTSYSLKYNTSGFFAFYGSSNTFANKYSLIEVVEDTRTALATPTNLSASLNPEAKNSIVLTWTAVEGAASYDISYNSKVVNVLKSGTSSETATITGLDYETSYTFNVVANPTDVTTYKKSDVASVIYSTGVASDPATSDIEVSFVDISERCNQYNTEWTVSKTESKYTIYGFSNNNGGWDYLRAQSTSASGWLGYATIVNVTPFTKRSSIDLTLGSNYNKNYISSFVVEIYSGSYDSNASPIKTITVDYSDWTKGTTVSIPIPVENQNDNQSYRIKLVPTGSKAIEITAIKYKYANSED